MCGPHQVWPLRSECCGRGVPTKVVCAECMKMCCLGGKNSVVKGLRASAHALRIETGRYAMPSPIPADQRTCWVCNNTEIEDEPHFMFSCKLYEELPERSSLLKYCCTLNHSFLHLSTLDKFLSRHRSAETQCWMRRYVRTSLFAMRPRKCSNLLYTLNRMSNVFIACK